MGSHETVIRVDNLSKRYVIRHNVARGRYTTLRDTVAQGATSLTRRMFRRPASVDPRREEFWALRDVSFEVKRGEVVGIIGRNGAGKSTLLKILSRITEPTTGRIEIDGRVASLLEVGTGFHPELTGRENVYLNGSILGMSRAEIRRKFDEIVAFAEVEKFLDTPVKRYSSGMYMRLAFAVAAHLEPEILVVDEVLAVGDATFQKKCLGKLGEVAKGGRTVLFVSHNMNAVEDLCGRVIRLHDGALTFNSTDVRAGIVSYLGASSSNAAEWRNPGGVLDSPYFRPTRFFIADGTGQAPVGPVRNDTPLFVHVEGNLKVLDRAIKIGYSLFTSDGEELYWSLSTDRAERDWPALACGPVHLCSPIPSRLLNEGDYRLELNVSLHFRDWFCRPGVNAPAIHFSIQGGLSESPYWMTRRPGVLAPVLPWNVIGEFPIVISADRIADSLQAPEA